MTPPLVRRFTRTSNATYGSEEHMELLVMTYLRASGGRCSHAHVARFAARLRLDPEALDRALVRVERAGSIRIDPGDPPCSENRTLSVLTAPQPTALR
jgi:hypothetical protein